MGRKLEQIVRSSYTGCVDNMTEVAKIITKFINQPLAEMIDTVDMKIRETIELLAGCLLTEDWDLSKESAETLKYTDLLCLIGNKRIDTPEDNDGYYSIDAKLPQHPLWYLGVGDIYILLKNAEKTSNLVKLFLSINVIAFFRYLYSISNDRAINNVWNTLVERTNALKIDIEADTSIKDILKQAEANRGTWNPWTPISSYYNKILFVFEIYSSLLIDCFKCAYPERFQMENIINNIKGGNVYG